MSPHPNTLQGRFLEALQFLMLPNAEKVRLSTAAVGSKDPPPWLNDRIMNSLDHLGFVHHVETSPEEQRRRGPGDMLATNNGVLWRVEITEAGRNWVKERTRG